MVRKGKLLEVPSISELGIYGTFLRRGDHVLLNAEAGHLVRTKVRSMLHVAALFSCLLDCHWYSTVQI